MQVNLFLKVVLIPEIGEILIVQPVFMKCILGTIQFANMQTFFFGKKILNVNIVKVCPKTKFNVSTFN